MHEIIVGVVAFVLPPIMAHTFEVYHPETERNLYLHLMFVAGIVAIFHWW